MLGVRLHCNADLRADRRKEEKSNGVTQADDSVDEEVLNHYCWMYSTFDIPEDFMVSPVHREIRLHNAPKHYRLFTSEA